MNCARESRLAAGVKVAFGTDTGVSKHGDNAKEFALMVRAGMTPAQAIRAATVTAAELLGRDDVGTIAVGKAADEGFQCSVGLVVRLPSVKLRRARAQDSTAACISCSAILVSSRTFRSVPATSEAEAGFVSSVTTLQTP